MRPTVIRLIAGGALGTAFSVALTLPGSVVFPDEPPIRQLAAPKAPTATVLHAAPLTERPSKAPAQSRVIAGRAYVPSAGTVDAASAVRNSPPRSNPSREPVERGPAEQRVTPLAAPPAVPVTEPEEQSKGADEPKRSDEPRKAGKPKKAEKPRKSEKPRKNDKPKKTKKPKRPKKPRDPGSEKKAKPDRKQDRDDQGEGRRGRDEDEGRGRRGDDGSHG